MADVSYTNRLKTIQGAMQRSTTLAGYPVDIRGQAIMERPDPWVELYLDRDARESATLGQGVPRPYDATVVVLCRVVAPGANVLASMESRDAMVDAVTEAIREQKAAKVYDLTGLEVGDISFADYTGEGGGVFSQAMITLNWLTKA